MHRTTALLAGLALVFLARAQYIAEILPSPTGHGEAKGASGGQIIGDAIPGVGGQPLIWDGQTHKFQRLSHKGFERAQVFGIGGGQQVGLGFRDNTTRAVIWKGPNSSPFDIHPSGYTDSIALGTDGKVQVGPSCSRHLYHPCHDVERGCGISGGPSSRGLGWLGCEGGLGKRASRECLRKREGWGSYLERIRRKRRIPTSTARVTPFGSPRYFWVTSGGRVT